MVDFKAPNHLMILIPAKINSPDYDDFIDMFNVPTPISPLPPTPVASPSQEQSQDAIYDSLPSMEQSTVPESPLKDLPPKSFGTEIRNEERRNEERRPRTQGCIEDPISDPRIEGDFKPRVFETPYAQQLTPTSGKCQILLSTAGWPCKKKEQWFHADQWSRLVCHGSRMSQRTV
ncbi:hypothetical protein TNCV_7611 [Trichonephila clavipes]|nr:hypothetical protein TNCV_7611 [Trichonephila clavipes]